MTGAQWRDRRERVSRLFEQIFIALCLAVMLAVAVLVLIGIIPL